MVENVGILIHLETTVVYPNTHHADPGRGRGCYRCGCQQLQAQRDTAESLAESLAMLREAVIWLSQRLAKDPSPCTFAHHHPDSVYELRQLEKWQVAQQLTAPTRTTSRPAETPRDQRDPFPRLGHPHRYRHSYTRRLEREGGATTAVSSARERRGSRWRSPAYTGIPAMRSTSHRVVTAQAGIVPHLPVPLLIGRDCPIFHRLWNPERGSRPRRDPPQRFGRHGRPAYGARLIPAPT